MKAEEFTEALAAAGHCVVGRVEGADLGTRHEQITLVELELSDGRCIEIYADTDIDHRPELLIEEVWH